MAEEEGSEKIKSGRLLGCCNHKRDLMLGTDAACMEVQGEPEAVSAADGARVGRCCMVLQERRRAIAGCLGRVPITLPGLCRAAPCLCNTNPTTI